MANMLISTVSMIVLVRLLGAEAYGLFGLGLLFAGFGEVLVGGHAADYLVKGSDVGRRHENAAFVLTTGLALATAVVLVVISPRAAAWFEAPELAQLLSVMAVLPVLTGLSATPNQLLVRRLDFAALARIDAFSASVSVVAGICLALAGAGVWSLALMELTRRLVRLIQLGAAAAWRPGLRFGRQDLRDVLGFAFVRIENKALLYLSQRALPRIFIGEYLGVAALGTFIVARRLLDQLHNVLSGPAGAVAFPTAARLQADLPRLRRLIAAAIRMTTWAFWPTILGLIVVSPVLLPLAFGPQWDAAVPVLQLLAIGSLRAPLSSFNSAVLVGLGAPRSVSLISLVSIVVGTVFLSVGVQYGLVGAAAALSLRQWALWPLGAVLVHRVSGFTPMRQLRTLAGAALPSLIMAGGVWWLRLQLDEGLNAALLLAVLVGSGVAAYPVVWAVFNHAHAGNILRAGKSALSGNFRDAKSQLALLAARAAS